MTDAAAELPAETEDQDQSPWPAFGCIAIIAVAIVAALWPLATCDFTDWDDQATVAHNPNFTPPSLHGLVYVWTHAHMGLYVPMTYTAWWAISILAADAGMPGKPAQLDPALFHVANLLLHVMASGVVWAILRRVLRGMGVSPVSDARYGRDARATGNWLACIGALFFALHPLQVEPVAWVSGLKDVLSGLFALIAIWQYLAFVDSPPRSIERKIRYLIVLAAAGFAMLSKPSSMVLPVILAILDWFVLRRAPRDIARSVIPILLVCLPCAILSMVIQHPSRNEHLWQRLLVVMDSFSFYAIKLFWPAKLAPDYGRRPTDALHSPFIWLCWVIPLIVAAVLWIVRRRSPLVVAGVFIFIAGVLPTLGFVGTLFQDKSTVADHYLYLSMLGISMIILAILGQSNSKPAWTAAIVLLIGCGVQSFRQTAHWRDSYALSSHNVQVSPRSWAHRLELANLLMAQKKYPEAEKLIREAIEIHPWSTTYLSLGRMLIIANRPADAIAPLQKTIELEPGIEGGRLALIMAYSKAGRAEDAANQLQELLREHPDDTRAQNLLRDLPAANPPSR